MPWLGLWYSEILIHDEDETKGPHTTSKKARPVLQQYIELFRPLPKIKNKK